MKYTNTQSPSIQYIHVPNIGLENNSEFDILGGTLRSISYKEWESLDSEAAHNAKLAYEKTRPVFFVCEDKQLDGQFANAESAANAFYIALLLETAAAIPNPATSIAYSKRLGSIRRSIGVLDRSAILHGPVKLRVNANIIESALGKVHLISGGSAILDLNEVRQIMRILSSTSLDDFEHIDGIVFCVMALESLLLKDVFKAITSTFVSRGINLLDNNDSENEELSSDLATAYSLRSDALHGRNWADSVAATKWTEEGWHVWCRRMLCRAVLSLLVRIGNEPNASKALDQFRNGTL